jgi:flagellar basal body P-ring protein FlgI
VPKFYKNNVAEFVTQIEVLDVQPDAVAKVIIDERTGTVVMGDNVKISRVAVAHGNLFVQVTEEPIASQPESFSPKGETVILPRTRIAGGEEEDRLIVVPEGIDLGEVVNGRDAAGFDLHPAGHQGVGVPACGVGYHLSRATSRGVNDHERVTVPWQTTGTAQELGL